MKALLDTHAFLWYLLGDTNLSLKSKQIIDIAILFELQTLAIIASIEQKQQEGVMQIVTSWMEQGIEQGKRQEVVVLILRQLNRCLGMLTPQMQKRIQNLSTTELEDLGEALLDFR